MKTINVTVWNEFLHEKTPRIAKIYPRGIHGAIQEMFAGDERFCVRTATLEEPDSGLPQGAPTRRFPTRRRDVCSCGCWMACGSSFCTPDTSPSPLSG